MGVEKKPETKRNVNAWMTTYTDLMTLLLTFFVLLLSMAVITEEKRLVALNSVTGAFGFKPGAHSIIGSPKGLNVTVGGAPMRKEEVDFEMMRNIELKNAMQQDMTIIKEDERIIISLSDRVLFKPGSSRIEEDRLGFLSELREALKESPSRIELRGYVASSEMVSDEDRLTTSMMLSAGRAFSVFRFFSGKGEIPAERIVAHGFGTNAAKKGTLKETHEANRQVEIILDYRERVPYRLSRPWRDSFLDFKGFLFKVPGGEHGS
ncbi:MAG: OmpA family protein [Deltaproteobacteria bacterium]|nr:OmpA family protein [Deltaproteobacteria bacterium]